MYCCDLYLRSCTLVFLWIFFSPSPFFRGHDSKLLNFAILTIFVIVIFHYFSIKINYRQNSTFYMLKSRAFCLWSELSISVLQNKNLKIESWIILVGIYQPTNQAKKQGKRLTYFDSIMASSALSCKLWIQQNTSVQFEYTSLHTFKHEHRSSPGLGPEDKNWKYNFFFPWHRDCLPLGGNQGHSKFN